MKRKFIAFLLLSGIILAAAVCFLNENETGILSLLPFDGAENYGFSELILMSVFTFPFYMLGNIISFLSGLGAVGNGFAFSVIALASLLSLVPVLKTYKIKEKRLRNFVLLLMCPLMAIVLAVFGSDAFLHGIVPVLSEGMSDNVKAVFGAAVWSGVVSVLLIELVGKIRKSSGSEILKLTKNMAYIVSVFLVIAISVFEVSDFSAKIETGIGLAEGYVSVLQFAKESLHYILDIAVISSAVSLIDGILENKSSDEISCFAHRLSKRCVKSLAAIVMVSFLYNFIQIMLSPVVFADIFVKIDVPVFSICFVLMILIISKLVTENKKLREDNDLFI